ncbi:MAG: hypothetical protein IPM69_15420 [Ignavibacteria bacterium]|nr:hypothetical protein [Ignavibacteria bacterium]
MRGQELKFTLTRLGITYKRFGELIGKSHDSVQRWVSYDQIIGEIHLISLRKSFSKHIFKQIESDWHSHLDAKKKREEEYMERRRIYLEEEKLRYGS